MSDPAIIYVRFAPDGERAFRERAFDKIASLELGLIDSDDKRFGPPEATHTACLGRCFGPIETRGNWPYISSVLMLLLGSPHVETVWYEYDQSCMDDDHDPATLEPFTLADLHEFTDLYVADRMSWYRP